MWLIYSSTFSLWICLVIPNACLCVCFAQWDFPHCLRKKLWPLWKTAGVMAMAPASKPHTEHTSSTCTQCQHLYVLDTAVSSVASKNVISGLAQHCKVPRAKAKSSLSGMFCLFCRDLHSAVSALAGEVPVSSIWIMQIRLTFLTHYFMQVLQAQSSHLPLPCTEDPWQICSFPRKGCRLPPPWMLQIVQLKPFLSQTEK